MKSEKWPQIQVLKRWRGNRENTEMQQFGCDVWILMRILISENLHAMKNENAIIPLEMPKYVTQHTQLEHIKGMYQTSTNTEANKLNTWKLETSCPGHKQTSFLLHLEEK